MFQKGQRQQENNIQNAETFRYQEKNDYNSTKNKNVLEKQDIQFVQVIPTEQSCYVQLMPESVSQRNIIVKQQSIQNEEGINNSLKLNVKASDIKEVEKIKKVNKQANQIDKNISGKEILKQKQAPNNEEFNTIPKNIKHAIKDQFEDQCLKFNDEITEVLSREETENTNRMQVFSKLQNFNENFQIQKIKKQIHNSSNNLFKLTQESYQDYNIIKTNQSNYNLNNIQQPMSTSNQDQYKFTTMPSPQSQFIKNPFSNPHHQSTTSFKQLPEIPLNTTTLGHSNIGNSFRFNTYIDSHRENEQLINYPCQDQDLSNILLNREIDRNTYSIIQQQEIKFQDEDDEFPMHLSTTIRQRIDKQCSNDIQQEQLQQQNQQQSNYDQQRQSISEIQSESNLASIKQLNCEIKGKPLLKESITLELQNEFKKQSYFYQEFNTLLTLNTQYLGGSLINTKTLNQNKRNSIQSFKNNRSLTLDQAAEKAVQTQTPKQRDLFLQGSITNRTIAGNSIKQYVSQDCDSQNQFGPLIFPIQEDYDGYSEDQYINSDKDIDQQSEQNENISQRNKLSNKNNLIYPSKKLSSKKFPRTSNFNASYMRSEKKDNDSIKSKHQKMSSFNQENDSFLKQNDTTQANTHRFQGTRLNQIPIEVYYQKNYQSDSNLLIDFGSDTAEANQIFQEDDQINASNNMLAIQKVQLVTKTKSDQDSQQALSNREYSNNLTQMNSQPQTPHKREADYNLNLQNQQNLILNLPSQYINQSTLNVQNSGIYSNTPVKSEFNVVFSPSRYLKQNNLDVQSINNASLDISKREQSLISIKSHNLSKIGLDKVMKLVWDFQFTKASCVFEDFSNQENVNMIIGHIYMLLIQFLISLKIDFAEKLCKLCEKVIDIIINQRAKSNTYLSLVQEINLTEMYLIKGILQFSLDKKIQGLFSLKNAFKYYQKCQSGTPNLVNSLKKNHRLKLNLLEGLNNLAKSALQESFKKVLSFFGQTFDLDKGLKTLLKVSQTDNNDQQNNSPQKINQCQFEQQQINSNILEDKKYLEYIKDSSGEDDFSFTSHVATIVLSLYYIWREKNPSPITNLINQKLKQYPKSPIYYWISYLINFEKKENIKAINDINKALSKANSFSKSCLSFKFEKSLFLTSNLRWNEASQILGQIGVQLLNFEEFKFEEFKQILQKAKINTNYFSNFYRTYVIDYKPEKHFFIGVSNLLLSQVACLIQQNQVDFAKEWLLLSQYFKKHSYLNMFLSNDIHNLSQLYLRRRNFNLVKYEIMYFTKTITKIPNNLIDQLMLEIDEEEKNIKQKQGIPSEDQKELAIEQSSCIFLKILVGCLQFDDKMIEKGEQELVKIPKFVNDSKYSDFSYLFHHSYYWICKFYFLQQKYDEALKNIKQMQKFSSKIFSLSQQAENILKLIKNQEQEIQGQK